jgi:hypothetical protein
MRFALRLLCTDGALYPMQRTVDRDDILHGADSAQRWLRLTHNVGFPEDHSYDRFEVLLVLDGEPSTVVAYGTLSDLALI